VKPRRHRPGDARVRVPGRGTEILALLGPWSGRPGSLAALAPTNQGAQVVFGSRAALDFTHVPSFGDGLSRALRALAPRFGVPGNQREKFSSQCHSRLARKLQPAGPHAASSMQRPYGLSKNVSLDTA
jgi:hypothetical protein